MNPKDFTYCVYVHYQEYILTLLMFLFKPGYYTFKLHARKSTYAFSARTEIEANEWIINLQDAIDTCPAIQTITERLVLEIIVS